MDRKTGKLVAVKLLFRDVSSNGRAVTHGHERERPEVELLDVPHPHLVTVQAILYGHGQVALAMELCTLGTIQSMIIEHGAISESSARIIARSVCEGLAFLHSKGITHGSVHPENIFVSSFDPLRVKTGEFGWVQRSDPQIRQIASVSPIYAAPEVQVPIHGLTFKNCTTIVDSWSLGLSLYYMLTISLPRGFDVSDTTWSSREFVVEAQPESKYWTPISMDARDLLQSFLTRSPEIRLSVTSAKTQHPWLNPTP
ncbi:kinase-like protein [Artomyces pyxidatus]|uniref:Kinase-like protein n=1 Tax=Artomyces pyxidatus TaxID=48021 RepID=A0ACB8SHX5_9AGAM|nr:kinase-like protein [Artomyces pyxidatus]